jgi:acetolactate synthase-1/2/3 large subunit
MRGSEIVIDVLRSEGVEVVFGYPGAATLPIYDDMRDSEIRHVLVRHEQCAAHMADGYARVKRSPGVCMATSGAGATNLVTGIATAFLDSSPVIALTGQVPTHVLGSDGFQEADIFSLMMPITKHNFRVIDPSTLADDLRSAFSIASSGRYAPVHVDLPRDVLEAEAGEVIGPVPMAANGARTELSQMGEAIRLLESADRPLILLGGGARWSGCGPQAMELADLLSSPVATTLMGKSCVPETHPLVLGMVGMHGRRAANYALDECDVLLAVGTRFSDRAIGHPDSCRMKVIHIDVDNAELGKNVGPKVALQGDAAAVLGEIIGRLKLRIHRRSWSDRVRQLRQECFCDFDISSNPISPKKVIWELQRLLPQDAIITTEVGQCQMWAAHYMQLGEGRTFITSGGLGTMGFGLPAAMGAKMAAPERKVVDIAGDGSLTMVCQELATAVEEDIPVLIALMNNGRLGMIKQHQRLFFGNRLFAEDLGTHTDFVKLAQAFGAKGARVDDVKDLEAVIEEGLASDTVFLMDIHVNTEEDVFPMTSRSTKGMNIIQGSCPYCGEH